MGIALATRVMAGEELRSDLLTRMLEPYWLDSAEVYAIFPASLRPSAKIPAIVDYLGESLDLPR